LESLHRDGHLTDEELVKAKNEQPAAYTKLNEAQKKEYDFARAIGISEADAFKLVKITLGYGPEYQERSARR
jgi:hypothetical protein